MLNNESLNILRGVTYHEDLMLEETHTSLVSYNSSSTNPLINQFQFQFHYTEEGIQYFILHKEALEEVTTEHPMFQVAKVLSQVRKLQVKNGYTLLLVGSYFATNPGDVFLLYNTEWLIKDLDPRTSSGYLTTLEELSVA